MSKYICIHGHFYQPPRENPWLNTVEMQRSAYPYHDWNERINAECYSRNSASRILDEEGHIIDIVNNYSRISFNFGPTLLGWMEKKAPETYQAILLADKKSQERFSGHGAAMAQCYNHLIMPLANARDRETQVIWGIQDFEYRFKRSPEGMWLPETAVDIPTLEVLAAHDITFTILSPYQAKRIRKTGEPAWKDVSGGKIDPRHAYVCQLPSGRTINIFFYDGPISQAIAFERLLHDGKAFAKRLLEQHEKGDKPQLVHIATDGETYGHHHRFGEMALSYGLHYIETHTKAQVTIYAEYLEKFPPEYEVEIIENTAWSSFPHLERWSSEGGGDTGAHPDWHQKWRAPLRVAFDALRDELIPLYATEMQAFVQDSWSVRDDYINVILDRSHANVEHFMQRHTGHDLSREEQVRFLKLLEMQYHTLLMYTSCGWFFDEVTGIETIQDIMYAARALQLASEISGRDYESGFVKLLEKAPSNKPKYGNAAAAYERVVKPAVVDMMRVGGHYAVSSLFSDYPKATHIYSFSAQAEHFDSFELGKYTLGIGRAKLTSEITWEEKTVTFAILHLGDHQLFGGVAELPNGALYAKIQQEMQHALNESNVYEVVFLMDQYFGMHHYSFWHLFRDDQKKVLDQVLAHTLKGVESVFEQVYENNFPLIQAVQALHLPLPVPLKVASDFTVNAKLKQLLEEKDVNTKELERIINNLKEFSVEIDTVPLSFQATEKITQWMLQLARDPNHLDVMGRVVAFLKIVKEVPLVPDLWHAQNIAFLLNRKYYTFMHEKFLQGDLAAQEWCAMFRQLYEGLKIKV